MNLLHFEDNYMRRMMQVFKPHTNVFIANVPNQVSPHMQLSKPAIDTISNWVQDEDPIDEYKLKLMEAYVCS